jgi:hypothetical protein
MTCTLQAYIYRRISLLGIYLIDVCFTGVSSLTGLHVIGTYLTAVSQAYNCTVAHLMDVYLVGVHLVVEYYMYFTAGHLTGVHLTGIHLTGVHLTGVHLTRYASH